MKDLVSNGTSKSNNNATFVRITLKITECYENCSGMLKDVEATVQILISFPVQHGFLGVVFKIIETATIR